MEFFTAFDVEVFEASEVEVFAAVEVEVFSRVVFAGVLGVVEVTVFAFFAMGVEAIEVKAEAKW